MTMHKFAPSTIRRPKGAVEVEFYLIHSADIEVTKLRRGYVSINGWARELGATTETQ